MGKKKMLRGTVFAGMGENCRKCGKRMKRFEHAPDWKPKANQPYYFRFWDKCSCKMLQHYEWAKVWVASDDIEGDPLIAEYRAIVQEPASKPILIPEKKQN